MRYKATGSWEVDRRLGDVVVIERADVLDTRNGRIYPGDAFRVLVDGKPVRGKGGTVPFFGEMAWASAERLANDLYWAKSVVALKVGRQV